MSYETDVTLVKVEEYLKEIMNLLNLPVTESTEDTPKRIARMWSNELFKNRNSRNWMELKNSMSVFPNEYGNDVISVREIEFHSVCEHHWLPFSGRMVVSYVPDEYVIGLSKIPRVVKYFSQQPQLQEKLCKCVGDYLFEVIKPKSIEVSAVATHQCVACRGAENDCKTVTVYRRKREDEIKGKEKAESDTN